MNRLFCSTQGDYSFIRCIFFGNPSSQITGTGGAIYLKNNGASLTIDSCQFHSIAVSGDGCALYINYPQKVNITDSLFDRCHPPGYEVGGVGAVFLLYCPQPLIQNCLFSSCTCSADGGAVYLYHGYCSWNNGIAVQDSRFICCKCTGETTGDGSDGGGLMTYANDELLGIRNCLFSHCYSYKGAGIYLCVPNKRSLTPIQFCCFIKNSGTYGNDVFVDNATIFSWSIIFSHSCTAGSAHTLGVIGNPPQHVANNWLPPTTINSKFTADKGASSSESPTLYE